jgi:hypothetical protein
MGTFKQLTNDTFISFSWHPQQNDRSRVMIFIQRREEAGTFIDDATLPFPGESLFVNPKSPEEMPPDKSIRVSVSPETIVSYSATFEGTCCFRVAELAEDEFSLEIRYPLSIYQAFCLALLRMR